MRVCKVTGRLQISQHVLSLENSVLSPASARGILLFPKSVWNAFIFKALIEFGAASKSYRALNQRSAFLMVLQMGNYPTEKRAGVRKKTLKGGTIVYQNGNCTMTCMILDLSATGAKLKPAYPVYVPETFDLVLPGGGTFRCELIRRAKDQIAVRFQ